MDQNERQQRIVERILEDEQLRGDLEDEAATALITWASERAAAAAADPKRPDAAVEAEVQAVRAAARTAARSGERDPKQLIAQAEALLAQSKKQMSAPAPTATDSAVVPAVPASALEQPAAQATLSAPAPAAPSIAQQAPASRPARTARPKGRRWKRFVGWLNRRRKGR